MEGMSLVVCSCDGYSDAWKGFFACLKEHWGDCGLPLYLISETKRADEFLDGVVYPLHGRGASGSWSWSRCVEEALREVKTELVLFMLDDFWLTGKVDAAMLERVCSLMREDKTIGFACLSHINPVPGEERECEYAELLEVSKKKPYRLTTQAGIWRRDYFIDMLRPHEAAWAFETRASRRSAVYGGKRVFCLNYNRFPPVFAYPSAGVLQAGRVIEEYVSLFPKDLYEGMMWRGMIQKDAERAYPGDKEAVWTAGLSPMDVYNKVLRRVRWYADAFKSVLPK